MIYSSVVLVQSSTVFRGTHLFWQRVEGKDGVLAILLSLDLIVAIHFIVASPLKEFGQQGICLRLLQVKDAACPTATRRVVHVNRLTLCAVLMEKKLNMQYSIHLKKCVDRLTTNSLQVYSSSKNVNFSREMLCEIFLCCIKAHEGQQLEHSETWWGKLCY